MLPFMIINKYTHTELIPIKISGTHKTTVSSLLMSERFLTAHSDY